MEKGLYKPQMNLRVNYKINRLPEVSVKNCVRHRHKDSPFKGVRNVKRFEILGREEKTAVLIVAPETGKLPDGKENLARYISGKAGGLGEVVSADEGNGFLFNKYDPGGLWYGLSKSLNFHRNLRKYGNARLI
jgi:hypothetical protein